MPQLMVQLSMPKIIRPLDHLVDAPCYWDVADDGASFRCSECVEYRLHSEVILTLTPDGRTKLLCRACVDDDWLAKARHMIDRI